MCVCMHVVCFSVDNWYMCLQKMTGGISFSFLDKDMYIHIGTDVFISRVNIDRCPFLFIDL